MLSHPGLGPYKVAVDLLNHQVVSSKLRCACDTLGRCMEKKYRERIGDLIKNLDFIHNNLDITFANVR